MSIFGSIKKALISAIVRNGKIRTRQELLRMSDSQLEDIGFSKTLLLNGVDAWPWRNGTVSTRSEQAGQVSIAVRPKQQNRRVVKQAVRELSTYSDRELAELGVTRHGIVEAVRFGRPAIEGVFESHQHAA